MSYINRKVYFTIIAAVIHDKSGPFKSLLFTFPLNVIRTCRY